MKAVYLPEGVDYKAGQDEVVIRTRDVTHLQHAAAQKATDVIGSLFGQHSFVLGTNGNPK